MSWNPKYAAHRYFRKRGDIVNAGAKLIIRNSPPPRNSPAYEKHANTLTALKYDFTNSLFISQ